jgi:hypothetical protein
MGLLDGLRGALERIVDPPAAAPALEPVLPPAPGGRARGTALLVESNRHVTGDANSDMGHVTPEDLQAAIHLIDAGLAAKEQE